MYQYAASASGAQGEEWLEMHPGMSDAAPAAISAYTPSPELKARAMIALGSVFCAAVICYVPVGLHLSLGLTTIGAASALLLFIFSLVIFGLRHHGFKRFGAANTVTAIRAAIVSLIAAAVLFPATAAEGSLASWAFVGLVLVALALDGVDGYLARRSGCSSALGARFDMEIDALLILCLSVAAYFLGKAGIWVLLIGLMRYGFVLAQVPLPRLRGDLPPSFRRKLVCVVQVAAMCLMLVPGLEPPLSTGIAAIALGLLAWSFAVDSHYLLSAARSGK